jgi:hypothetical protein
MNVSGVNQRRTADLVDDLAHQAQVVDKEHHISGSTTMKSGTQLHKERHGTAGAADAGKSTAIGVAKEMVPEIIEHYGRHGVAGGAQAAGRVAGLGVVGGIGIFAYECLHELATAEKKGAEIRAAFDNDAVNVALAKTLAFNPAFGEVEATKRPGVSQASARLSAKLNEPSNAAMKAVFQARADEGFVAAERGGKAVAHLPEAERPAAFARWMKDNGFGERMENDVAFGKGVEHAQWIHSAQAKELGVDQQTEMKKVEDRQPPPQVFRRAG